MGDFTPLVRRTIDLETAVSGAEILSATEAALEETNKSNDHYDLRPREGSDDGTALVYIKVHSADRLNEIVVIPAGEDSVNHFIKEECTYTHLFVALSALGSDTEDEEIKDFLEVFAQELRDQLYEERDRQEE